MCPYNDKGFEAAKTEATKRHSTKLFRAMVGCWVMRVSINNELAEKFETKAAKKKQERLLVMKDQYKTIW